MASWADVHAPLRLAGRLVPAAYEDLAFVAVLTAAAAAAYRAASPSAALRRGVVILFLMAVAISLLLGFVNVRAVEELGRPINYQWLYYSHFMRSMDTYTALAALLSWKWVGEVAAAATVLVLASEVLARGMMRLIPRFGTGRIGAAVTASVAAYFIVAWPTRSHANAAPQLENPVLSLVRSFLGADASPVLAHVPTRVGADDFLTAAERGAQTPRTAFTGRARGAGVRNILVVVLESVGAPYVSGFGGPSGATPTLERYQPASRRFTVVYAHQPSTSHSMVGLLLAVYPPNTFRTVTREHPDIRLPSWSGELKRQGYRTAFFNAGDNQFQNEAAFLAHREFDEVADGGTNPCSDAEIARLGSDECTMRGLSAWIQRDPSRPFFAVVWTIQTHFPYTVTASASGSTTAAPHDAGRAPARDSMSVRLERYRQALRESDRAIATLLGDLDRRGLLDSTLVAIVGDHGEAFGQHGNTVHRYLYEEEVHIPCMLINGRLFHGETDPTPGGLIDLAPTIMDLLGYPVPGDWQGRTLFATDRSGRVYLFGPYSGWFGFREGDRKLIYNAISDESQLYDLAGDAGEQSNLAATYPGIVQQGRERLAAWVQYQDRFYRRVLGDADPHR